MGNKKSTNSQSPIENQIKIETEEEKKIDLSDASKDILFMIGMKLIDSPKTLINYCCISKKNYNMINKFYEELMKHHFPQFIRHNQKIENLYKKDFLRLNKKELKILILLIPQLKKEPKFFECEAIFRLGTNMNTYNKLTEEMKNLNEKECMDLLLNTIKTDDVHCVSLYIKKVLREENEIVFNIDEDIFYDEMDEETQYSTLSNQILSDQTHPLIPFFLDFIHFISSNSEVNRMIPQNMSIIFSSYFFKTDFLNIEKILQYHSLQLKIMVKLIENSKDFYSE